ncbi:MAG: N-acetyl-lysine deacetylase [Desulfurococcales archaeon]|nr:N-acetyl-lysine deacetylase [Desulfurococcales archaeon]
MDCGTASAGCTAARLLYDLLKVYTPPGSEEKALPVIAGHAARLGLQASIDKHGNIIVEPRDMDGMPVVLLASHVDTVPGFIEPAWEGTVLRGRGAVDAKGPLAAMIAGLALAYSEGLQCKAAAAALAGEEAESPGAWGLLSEGMVPPYVVIGEPTGGDGVAIGYRGSMKARIECRDQGGHAASTSGAANRLVRALAQALASNEGLVVTILRAGEAWNVAPSRAEAVVDYRAAGTGVDMMRAAAGLCDAVAGEGCWCSEVSMMAPIRVELGGLVPRSLVRALRAQGVRPRVVVKQGTSDMNILGRAAASIAAYGPGDARLAHTDREAVTVEELDTAARVYASVLKSVCDSIQGG